MALFTRLPIHYRQDLEKILDWILENVPCFNHALPYEWTQRVLREASNSGARIDLTYKAMKLARDHGYHFVGLPVSMEEQFSYDNVVRTKSIDRTVAKSEANDAFAHWEEKYQRAVRNNDLHGQQVAFSEALLLMYGLAYGLGRNLSEIKKRRDEINARIEDTQQWNRAVNEAMQRARTLRKHFRQLSREELTRLRESPTPTMFKGVAFRIAGRIIRPRNAQRRNLRTRR